MEDGVQVPTETALPAEIPDLVALLEFQEQIVQVCQKLKTLIDPTDDLYVVQKSLANEGIVPIFVELLSSVKNGEQLIELCETVGVLCANIEGVATRKRSGLESGFQERSFNPVQNELAEYNGFRYPSIIHLTCINPFPFYIENWWICWIQICQGFQKLLIRH